MKSLKTYLSTIEKRVTAVLPKDLQVTTNLLKTETSLSGLYVQ